MTNVVLSFRDDPPVSVVLEFERTSVYVDHDRDETVVQVGKVQMTVSQTGVRLVSREGPATGHARCHEVEMWRGEVPS